MPGSFYLIIWKVRILGLIPLGLFLIVNIEDKRTFIKVLLIKQ